MSKRLLSLALTVFVCFCCNGGEGSLSEQDLPVLNKTIDFTMSTGSNISGHWISRTIVKETSNQTSTKLHVKVNQSYRNNGDAQIIQLDGTVVVPPIRPADYELFPGVGFYKFHTENAANFDDAVEKCASEGGHLAIINSETESLVLQEIFSRYPREGSVNSDWAFVGFHDRYKEGLYLTIFGEPLNSTGYVKWVNPKQPDDYHHVEDCGSMHRNGGLNDIGCFGEFPFFCEYDLTWGYL